MIYAETLGLCRIRGLVKLARFHRNQTAHQGRWAGPMPWNNAHTHTRTHIYIFNYLFIYLYILAEGLRFPGSRFRMLLSKYLHIPDGSDLHLGPNAIPHLMCPETRLFFTNPEIDMNLWMDMNQHKHWTHIIQSRKAYKLQHQAIPKNNI